MTDPLFWLVLSLLFVTISLTIVLVVAIPTLRELSRAARSAEKLFDTLRREFPPTLQAIRLTGLEISDLTDDVSEGVQSAGQVVKQVDQSLTGVRQQAQRVQSSTRSVVVGIKAAWRTFTRSQKVSTQRRGVDRLPTPRSEIEFGSASRDIRTETRRVSPDAASSQTAMPATSDTPMVRNPDLAFDNQNGDNLNGVAAPSTKNSERYTRSPDVNHSNTSQPGDAPREL